MMASAAVVGKHEAIGQKNFVDVGPTDMKLKEGVGFPGHGIII